MGDTHDDCTVAVFCNVKFVWNCVFASLEVLRDIPRPHTNVEELLLGGIKLQQRAGTPQDDYEPCRAVVQRRSVASLQTQYSMVWAPNKGTALQPDVAV